MRLFNPPESRFWASETGPFVSPQISEPRSIGHSRQVSPYARLVTLAVTIDVTSAGSGAEKLTMLPLA
jgi:hypothetical protein